MREFLLQLRWRGRFGNRLCQYAYGATYARLTGLPFWIPAEWEGTRLFRHQPHRVVETNDIRLALTRPDEDAASDRQRLETVQRYYPDARLMDVELAPDPYVTPGHPLCHANGCAYNQAVFARMSRGHLQSLCEFSDEVMSLEAYKRYSDMQGLYDVAHLRRDDVSNAEYNRHHIQGYRSFPWSRTVARSGSSAIRKNPSRGYQTTTPVNGMSAGKGGSLAVGSTLLDRNTCEESCSTGSMIS